MKTFLVVTLASVLMLSSCASSQFGGAMNGASLGGMLGSAIGGILGGPRGADIGTVVGIIGGGAAGAAATAPKDSRRSDDGSYSKRDDNHYDADVYPSENRSKMNNGVEVRNIQFYDANNNQTLNAGETGTLVMEIYNQTDKMLYNITPQIACNNKRVRISAPATIMNIEPGDGVRYRAIITAPRKLKLQEAIFSIGFNGSTVRNFSVATSR